METRTDLLEYHKAILDKISHADVPTFRKELRKAFRRLMPHEREVLKGWFRSACLCRVEQGASMSRPGSLLRDPS
jgi:hypothetical protein